MGLRRVVVTDNKRPEAILWKGSLKLWEQTQITNGGKVELGF